MFFGLDLEWHQIWNGLGYVFLFRWLLLRQIAWTKLASRARNLHNRCGLEDLGMAVIVNGWVILELTQRILNRVYLLMSTYDSVVEWALLSAFRSDYSLLPGLASSRVPWSLLILLLDRWFFRRLLLLGGWWLGDAISTYQGSILNVGSKRRSLMRRTILDIWHQVLLAWSFQIKASLINDNICGFMAAISSNTHILGLWSRRGTIPFRYWHGLLAPLANTVHGKSLILVVKRLLLLLKHYLIEFFGLSFGLTLYGRWPTCILGRWYFGLGIVTLDVIGLLIIRVVQLWWRPVSLVVFICWELLNLLSFTHLIVMLLFVHALRSHICIRNNSIFPSNAVRLSH